jgi:lipopolysaccharide/colanic/teichoic acid biosynthesis glycosyltransferase
VTAPLLAVIALAVRLDSTGPVFYRGVRVGRGGKRFRIWKFRTMVTDAEKIGGRLSPESDARVTRVGRSLRQSKLDEFPQLLNVLKGEMSMVGPRPEAEELLPLYGSHLSKLLTVRPGITDWASIWGVDEGRVLDGRAATEDAYASHILPNKISLQLHYIDNISIWTDIKIIFLTVIKIFARGYTPGEIKRCLVEAGEEPAASEFLLQGGPQRADESGTAL